MEITCCFREPSNVICIDILPYCDKDALKKCKKCELDFCKEHLSLKYENGTRSCGFADDCENFYCLGCVEKDRTLKCEDPGCRIVLCDDHSYVCKRCNQAHLCENCVDDMCQHIDRNGVQCSYLCCYSCYPKEVDEEKIFQCKGCDLPICNVHINIYEDECLNDSDDSEIRPLYTDHYCDKCLQSNENYTKKKRKLK